MNRLLITAAPLALTTFCAVAANSTMAPQRFTCSVSGLIASDISYSFELEESVPRITWTDNASELSIFHLAPESLEASRSPERRGNIYVHGIEFRLDRKKMELHVKHYGKPKPALVDACEVGLQCAPDVYFSQMEMRGPCEVELQGGS